MGLPSLRLSATMAFNPIPMVMIGFILIALANVSAAAYEPSASSLMMPIEFLKDSPVLEESTHLLPAAQGCSVPLPKLGTALSNSTTKTTKTSQANACSSSTTTKKTLPSVTTKQSAVKTPPAAVETPAVVVPETSAAQQEVDEVYGNGVQFEDLESSVETLRDDVEQACAQHDGHDEKVVCMIHEVLQTRGHVEPLSIEKDGNKVQVVSMLQEDQVVFEDKMDDVSLLME